jgi:NADPH2:quinone reductase
LITYKGFRIHKKGSRCWTRIDGLALPEPAPGEVLVRVTYSSLNYKDALAGTGRGQILRTFPLVGGIDAAGVVVRTEDARFSEGLEVIATGWGMSYDHDGGYAQYLCVPGDWLVPCPTGLDARSAMILGTAGFTAALAIHRLLVNAQMPEMGPILVTGASGGVGSIAVDILNRLGFEVVAVSGKPALHDWLRTLGAQRVLGREELPEGMGLLGPAVWGGAIDNVGGDMLARITRTVRPRGNIASIGLAGGRDLNTSVMPFILRGVSLLGCNSVDVPQPLRRLLWEHLAGDWRPPHLVEILTATETLETLPRVFDDLLAGRLHGRVLVDISGS